MKKKSLFLFFFLPLIGIVVIFFILSSWNRAYIKNKVEGLVEEQLKATAEILKANISHYLSENISPDEIFNRFSGEENIYYMALLDEQKEILGWRSRFEGYLPLSQKNLAEKDAWIITSPAGRIFNIFSSFTSSDQKTYYIYLGYSLVNLEEMIAHSRQNFLILLGIIAGIGIIFFLGTYQIQSHYIQKEKEAVRERKEKERYREISAFTSGVAHEIKNPLNSLSLLLELFEKKMPPEFQEKTSQGREEIRKISRIIDQFSASLTPLHIQREKFLLEDLIAEIFLSLKKEKDLSKIEMNYAQETNVIIDADRELLRQALGNILKNSIEATKEGKIEVKAKEHKRKIYITVQDTGKGISQEDQNRVFDPFFSKKKQGMGIGLYLTKKIIEAHEGKMEFSSQLGKGTTFLIQFSGGRYG